MVQWTPLFADNSSWEGEGWVPRRAGGAPPGLITSLPPWLNIFCYEMSFTRMMFLERALIGVCLFRSQELTSRDDATLLCISLIRKFQKTY